jgi:hypothetical protein
MSGGKRARARVVGVIERTGKKKTRAASHCSQALSQKRVGVCPMSSQSLRSDGTS